jgi:hypothetical protein
MLVAGSSGQAGRREPARGLAQRRRRLRVALVVRIVAAAAVSFPIPEDTAYYAGVARNLVEGRGLISDALWSYQTQPLVVPRAAFEVWMPLPSLLEAIPVALAGAANWFRAAQVVSVLASSIVAVLAWRLGADVAAEMELPAGRARTMGVGAGLVAAVLGPLVLYGALPIPRPSSRRCRWPRVC